MLLPLNIVYQVWYGPSVHLVPSWPPRLSGLQVDPPRLARRSAEGEERTNIPGEDKQTKKVMVFPLLMKVAGSPRQQDDLCPSLWISHDHTHERFSQRRSQVSVIHL